MAYPARASNNESCDCLVSETFPGETVAHVAAKRVRYPRPGLWSDVSARLMEVKPAALLYRNNQTETKFK